MRFAKIKNGNSWKDRTLLKKKKNTKNQSVQRSEAVKIHLPYAERIVCLILMLLNCCFCIHTSCAFLFRCCALSFSSAHRSISQFFGKGEFIRDRGSGAALAKCCVLFIAASWGDLGEQNTLTFGESIDSWDKTKAISRRAVIVSLSPMSSALHIDPKMPRSCSFSMSRLSPRAPCFLICWFLKVLWSLPTSLNRSPRVSPCAR